MTAIKKITENADNAYYATEYDKAIELYKHVLDSDPDNKHAQQQIRKAEINRPSKNVKPQDVPPEALQLYKRSRSFIAVGDKEGARKLLKQAIAIAVDFPGAEELLRNIQNAIKAEEIKKTAVEEFETQQWAKAESNLEKAVNLDPTDDVAQTLLSHLRNLLRAQSLIINSLNEGSGSSADIKEIRNIINLTDETTALSKLWQEVVKLFRKYNHASAVFREGLQIVLSVIGVLLITFGLLYLYPRHREVEVNCGSISPGLHAKLNYPYYVAKGDKYIIEIRFINDGKSEIDDSVVLNFQGTANVVPVNSNVVKLELIPGEEKLQDIEFSVNGSTSIPYYIIFNVGSCIPEDAFTPEDLHIAMTPIPYLHTVLAWAVGSTGIVALIITFFREKIINLFSKKKEE